MAIEIQLTSSLCLTTNPYQRATEAAEALAELLDASTATMASWRITKIALVFAISPNRVRTRLTKPWE